MPGRLVGEKALVTGSTAGLGAEIARVFAAEGAAVVVTGRDERRGATVCAGIRSDGGAATFVAADLVDRSSCTALVQASSLALTGLTIVVTNAIAAVRDAALGDLAEDAWDEILRVDLSAAAWVVAAAVPHLAAAGGGAIVNVCSQAVHRPAPAHAAYVAAKGGLLALGRAVAVDYAAAGVRCNTVSPGYVLHEVRDATADDDRLADLRARQLTRLVTARDVALACVFLASREAATITGVELAVDGGAGVARARVFG